MRASLIKRNSILKKNLVNNVNRKQTLITKPLGCMCNE